MGAVRPLLVVELSPAFDQHLRLGAAAKPFPVQQLVAQLAVEAFDEAVLPRAARRDEGRADRRVAQQRMTLVAVNSAPLSERTKAGLP